MDAYASMRAQSALVVLDDHKTTRPQAVDTYFLVEHARTESELCLNTVHNAVSINHNVPYNPASTELNRPPNQYNCEIVDTLVRVGVDGSMQEHRAP